MRNRHHLWKVNNRNVFIVINLHDIGINEFDTNIKKNIIICSIIILLYHKTKCWQAATRNYSNKQIQFMCLPQKRSCSIISYPDKFYFYEGFKTHKSTQTRKGKRKRYHDIELIKVTMYQSMLCQTNDKTKNCVKNIIWIL